MAAKALTVAEIKNLGITVTGLSNNLCPSYNHLRSGITETVQANSVVIHRSGQKIPLWGFNDSNLIFEGNIYKRATITTTDGTFPETGGSATVSFTYNGVGTVSAWKESASPSSILSAITVSVNNTTKKVTISGMPTICGATETERSVSIMMTAPDLLSTDYVYGHAIQKVSKSFDVNHNIGSPPAWFYWEGSRTYTLSGLGQRTEHYLLINTNSVSASTFFQVYFTPRNEQARSRMSQMEAIIPYPAGELQIFFPGTASSRTDNWNYQGTPFYSNPYEGGYVKSGSYYYGIKFVWNYTMTDIVTIPGFTMFYYFRFRVVIPEQYYHYTENLKTTLETGNESLLRGTCFIPGSYQYIYPTSDGY